MKDLPYLRIGPRFDYAPKIHRCFLERHICGNSSTCLAVLHLPQYAPRHPSHFCQGHFSLHCSFSMAAHLAPIRTSNFSFLGTKSSYVPFTSFIPDVKSFLVFISLNRNHYFFNYLDKLFFYSGKIFYYFVGILGQCWVKQYKNIPKSLILQGFSGYWDYSSSLINS